MWEFLTILYILIVIATTPFVVKDKDWCFWGIVFYLGLCFSFTPIIGIPIWKFLTS